MHFKNLLKVSCFILLSLFSLQSMAQTVVTGKVTDSKDGSGIPGASVVAKGTTVGTVTDVNGNFRLSVASSVTTLSVSYVGYTTKDVTLTGAPLNIALDPTSTSLNEVLVVGYGTVRKKDATGAVVKVNAGDFVQGVTTNPLQQLQGQAPGVVIATTSGDPNDAPTVRVRGTTSLSGGNDPLYVIDGVAGADIRSVAPSDIESFTIEKDASAAAIYGSRAAGGVILVTTKQGKAGKSQVTFNSYVASESPEHLIKFMDRNQYLDAYQNDNPGNTGKNPMPKFDPAHPSTTVDQGANTDWFREITRTGFTHSENLALSGGTEQGHYRASVSYTDQDGIAINSGRKDLYGRFNFDQKTLNDKLLITMNVSGSQTNSLFNDKNAFLNAAAVPSVISPRDPNAPDYYQFINNTQETNPIPQLIYITNIGRVDRLVGNLHLDYNITKALTLSPYANASHGTNVTNIYYPPAIALRPDALSLLNAVGDQFGYAPQLSNNGDVDKGESDYTNKTYGATLSYKETFGKLRLSALGGYEFNAFDYSGFRVGAHDFNDIDLPDENIGSANSITTKDIGSDRGGYQLKSWFGRTELNWNDKYYLTGNVRYDWSNKLGLNDQSGVFPSVDAAWTISNEDFMKGVNWITSLKLRGGWGQVGNQDVIGPYTSQFLFSSGNPYYNGGLGAWVSSSTPVQNQNANLRWQVNTTTNVAVDFSLFNGRLSGSLDIYSEKTKHLLYTYTVPTGSTFFVSTILANIGSMSNKGFDFSLNYKIMSKSNFTWSAGGNLNVNRNKIETLSGTFQGLDFNVTQANVGSTSGLGISGSISQIGYLKVGYPIGTLLLPEYAGLTSDGKQQFWKYNPDGSRTAVTDVSLLSYADDGSTQDRKFYTTDPKFTYGLSTNLTYKQWDFSIFARGQYGSHGFNETYMDYTSLAKLGTYSVLADATKYGINSSSQPSTYWLQGTSFLKIQSINLGYSLKINQNRYIDKLHFYVAGNNLYTFTSYKGIDPELTTTGGETGIDTRTLYPRPRQLSFGVNLTLK